MNTTDDSPRTQELVARKREAWRRWYQKNKASVSARNAIYKAKHKEALKIKVAAYKKANPEWISEQNKRHKAKHREKILARQRHRYATEPNFRLSRLMRCALWRMAKFGWKKAGPCTQYIGCEFNELRLYLESKFKPGMTWANHGQWEIDHITPLSWFDLTDDAQCRKAWHYTNLQPLWKHENRTKQASYAA